MRISDWSSDVCSSDLPEAGSGSRCWTRPATPARPPAGPCGAGRTATARAGCRAVVWACRRRPAQPWFPARDRARCPVLECQPSPIVVEAHPVTGGVAQAQFQGVDIVGGQAQQQAGACGVEGFRSEEHTSELPSLMRISYAVFGLKKKTKI